MLKKILIVLAVGVVGFVGFALTRPDTYKVERSATVKAPPAETFAVVSDLQRFTTFSPWEKRDPAMKKTFSPSTSGVGASYAWQGNKEVGSGKMTITEHTPTTRVRYKLEFIEPFASLADTTFDVAPADAGSSKVTWSMTGHNNFVSKAMGVFMDFDKMIGKDFEEGLANLGRVLESKAAPSAPAAAAAAPASP